MMNLGDPYGQTLWLNYIAVLIEGWEKHHHSPLGNLRVPFMAKSCVCHRWKARFKIMNAT